jgi:conjugal transfer/entry exclusion protein
VATVDEERYQEALGTYTHARGAVEAVKKQIKEKEKELKELEDIKRDAWIALQDVQSNHNKDATDKLLKHVNRALYRSRARGGGTGS